MVGPAAQAILTFPNALGQGAPLGVGPGLAGVPWTPEAWLVAGVAVLTALTIALSILLIGLRRQALRRTKELEEVHAAVAERVNARTLELESARHRMMQILHAAGEGIYGIDKAGLTTFCNPAGLRMLGYAHEAEVFRRPLHALVHHHRADGSPYALEDCPIAATLQDGRVASSSAEVFWRKDGSSFPVEFTSNPVTVEGEVTGAVVVFRDIGARLAKEAELQQSNRDLEAYAMLASHDLQAPLRQVLGFADLLNRQAAGLDDDGKECLRAISESAVRMQAVIDSLLTYSKVASRKPSFEEVSLDGLVHDVLGIFAVPLKDAGASVVVGSLPTVVGDAGRLFQVFQNLVQNSIRYRSPDRPLRLEITAESKPIWHRITVRDNGVGFDEVHSERIFAMFQRLQEKSKAGVGLGLAIARRTLEQHGGTIRAEGVPGEGASFIIELPRGAQP